MKNVKYSNSEETSITAEIDGSIVSIPVSMDNRHYREIIDQEIEIDPFEEDLSAIQFQAKESIRIACEEQRASVINALPAKILVYQRKSEIAKAAIAGDQTALALLQREADARSESPIELAHVIVNTENAWTYVAFQIDAIEEEAQSAINVADTIEEVNYVVEFAKNELIKAMAALAV